MGSQQFKFFHGKRKFVATRIQKAKSYLGQIKSAFHLLKDIIKTERNFIKRINVL